MNNYESNRNNLPSPADSFPDQSDNSGATVNEAPIVFRDPVFEHAIREDMGLPPEVPLYPSTLANVRKLDVSSWAFRDMSEIMYFTNLEELLCYRSFFTSLDLSSCKALTRLDCHQVDLRSGLDVSACTRLEWLRCSDNGLNSLDLSSCPALKYLACENNALTDLNVSGSALLEHLSCDFNSLASLDVSACPRLEWLSCSCLSLQNLDLSACAALKFLDCSNLALASLNLSACADLQTLACHNCRFTSLDLSACVSLTAIHCQNCYLRNLDLSACAALNTLNCTSNHLMGLDVTRVTKLTSLQCSLNFMPSKAAVIGLDESRLTRFEFDPQRSKWPVEIAVTHPPSKTAYRPGETLDLTGLVVTVIFEDESTKPVTVYKTSPENGAVLTSENSVLITYEHTEIPRIHVILYAAFPITVTSANEQPVAIAVASVPDRTRYVRCSRLDLSGLRVKLIYNDGTSSILDRSSYETEPRHGTMLWQLGRVPVSIEYFDGQSGVLYGCFCVEVFPQC